MIERKRLVPEKQYTMATAREEIDSLDLRLRDLGSRLTLAGERLSKEQTLPEPDLLQELDHALTDLDNARKHLEKLAISVDLPPLSTPCLSLADLRARLQQIFEAEQRLATIEDIRGAALAVLDRIQFLAHREHVEFKQLLECQARARDQHLVLTQATTLPPEAEALANGTHPFSLLLEWIESGDRFDDEQWQRANDSVAETFGKLLATAVARSKLLVGNESRPCSLPTREEMASPPEEMLPAALEESLAPEVILPVAHEEPLEPDMPVPAQESFTLEEPQLERASREPQPQAAREETASDAVRAQASPTGYDQEPDKGAAEIRMARLEDLRSAMWSLIANDRLGLAFHIARHVELSFSDDPPILPSWLAQALALSPHVSTQNGSLAAAIQADFSSYNERVFERDNEQWNQAIRFLLAASALRPALIAPNTGGAAILQTLRFQDGLNSLYQLCQTIAGHANTGMPLSPSALRGVRTQAAWDDAVAALQREVNAWWDQSSHVTIIYAPATKVWRTWLMEGGPIHSLLAPVRNDDGSRQNVVQEWADRLSDDIHVKREIDDTDRRKLKRRIGDDISAKALTQLLNHTRQAVDLARRWLDLRENNPALAQNYVQGLVAKVREGVGRSRQGALSELEAVADRQTSAFVKAAAHCCLRAVTNVAAMFDPDSAIAPTEPTPNEILNVDLLYGSVPLESSLEIVSSFAETADAVLDLCKRNRFDIEEAFELRDQQRDHQGTALIIEQLCCLPAQAAIADQFRERRSSSLKECRAALERDIEQTQKAVETAVGLGLLLERERIDLVARVDSVRMESEVLQFQPLHDQLQSVRVDIEAKRSSQVREVQARLEATKVDAAVAERIRAVITRGDVLTANEYIDLVRTGRPLPDEKTQSDVFMRFFSEYFRAIEGFLEPQDTRRRPDPVALVRDLRALAKGNTRPGGLVWPIPVSQVRGKQLEQAADMLDAWFTTKRSQRADVEVVRRILAGVGLAPQRVELERPSRHRWVRVECEPVRDRERCPVTFFGSSAEGHYRLLCAWDRPTEDDLISAVGETMHGTAVIVLYFGRMTEKLRRELTERCRRRRRTFIVLDDVMILYLCGERGSRLPTLFRCTLPFTFLEPYAATAGLVPPEMFYGRAAERNQIVDLTGSCFIYGGRQLGKTALLRDVEQSFHDPAAGRIALWLDLKTYGIGIDRSVEELWPRFLQEFKRLGVIPANTPPHASADTILNHVQQWLDQSRDRRVLLLLDEADRFLDQDGKEDFAHTARLKGLMDRTSRRFKVVFAGLHNVQRTTRLENNPLAHYGEPICIGPLLDNGEWEEARHLVEEPFASVGYRFESPDLVTRILSQTNYYPSLIQLYCNQLLRHMYERRAEATGPPFMITSRDVEEAYQSQDLRRAIRDRFTWTLDLDPRYRLIVFCLALNVCEQPGDADRGVMVAWIREQALSLWPKGFQDVRSEDVFRVLLDEMVGLGLLRVDQSGHYGLRSLNVISLLGSRDEIEAEIYSFIDREPPPPFEPSTFRASFRGTDGRRDPARRNPLTAEQESELRARRNGVSIIFGCGAAGIPDLDPFLKLSFGNDYFISLDAVADMATFLGSLKQLDDRHRDGVTLLLVSASSAWSSSWIREALVRVKKFTSKNAFVRVAFLADPMTAWTVVAEVDQLVEAGANTINLAAWHDSALQQWLDDCGFSAVHERDRARISEITGNWPVLLRLLYDRCREAPHQWSKYLDEMNVEIERRGCLAELDAASLFGITRSEASRALGDLAEMEEASVEDLAALSSEIPLDLAKRILRWGTLLSFVQPVGRDQFRIDPTLGRFLTRSRRAAG